VFYYCMFLYQRCTYLFSNCIFTKRSELGFLKQVGRLGPFLSFLFREMGILLVVGFHQWWKGSKAVFEKSVRAGG